MHNESFFWYVNGNDESWMSHIDQKRDYDSFSRHQWNLEDLDFLLRIITNTFNFLNEKSMDGL